MKIIVLFILMVALAKIGIGQETILLYPDYVPGAKKITIEEESITTDGITRVKHVTKPLMFIYQPQHKTTDAAVLICPGGGYGILAIDHEGYDIAQWFNSKGMTAFVLKYRLPEDELFDSAEIRPLQDVQQAFRIIRKNAMQLGVSPDKVGIMGFSAGGHLASTASTHFDIQTGEIKDESISVRPDFSILIYPVITFGDVNTHSGTRDNLIGSNATKSKIEYYSNELHVAHNTPPTFLISTSDDFVSVQNSILYYQACKMNNVSAELHIYETGGHGYALKKRNLGQVESWPERMEDWLRAHELIK